MCVAKLVIISSPDRPEFQLVSHNSLGRHPNNSIQVLDRILSKEHAVIIQEPTRGYVLKDLGSLNGTYVAGQRITEHVLRNGDTITLGTTQIVFMDQNANAGDTNVMPRVQFSGPQDEGESMIRGRIQASGGEFLPATQISDERTLRTDYERLRTAHLLAKAFSTELNLDKLMPKILEQAFQLVKADRGAILLMDGDELVPYCVKTKSGKQEDIKISNTVLAEVTKNKAALLSSDASVDSRFSGAQSIIMQGIRSTMTVPLLHADEIQGVMHLDSMLATTLFTEKDLQICLGFAAQAATSIQNARLADRIEKEAASRAEISRLIPPSVVEQVMNGELRIDKGGQFHEITMLYSDIRGFTAMSESKSPVEVVNTLNEYFEVMVDVLFKHSGTLDKFVGDEIIGLFGAPIPIQGAPLKAVRCALEMMSALQELNRTRQAEGQVAIEIGIGINTGHVITGAIGSTRALQYTAIGDAMNTASRLVSVAKPGETIISEETFKHVSSHIAADAMEPVRVKGKSEALKIYRVRGIADWGGNTMEHSPQK